MAHDVLRVTLSNVGTLLTYIGFVPLVLVVIAGVHGEWFAVPGILLTAGAFMVAGWLLSRIRSPRDPRLREGMLIAALAWLLVPLGSVLLFVFVEDWRFVDAFFETMSAWTGTGMTLADVTALTHTTLAWRSLMQWVGGLGVIVLTLAILARPGTGAYTLYAGEAREEKLRPSVLSTVRTLWWIYCLYTIAAIGLLMLVGLPAWHAFNHALTGISTAGMSILPGSVGDYDNPAVELALVVIMIMGAIAFVAHYALLRGRWRAFLRDEQVRATALILAVGVPVIAYLLKGSAESMVPWLREALFQVTSATTTTGFQTADLAAWTARSKLLLAGVMLLGGAAGSTSGGFKLVRGVLLVKGAMWKLERAGQPHFAVSTFRFGGRKLTTEEAHEQIAEAAFVVVLWIVLLFFGAASFLAMVHADPTLENVMFDLASAIGNVGLTTGAIGPALPDDAKYLLVGLMWAARLEILPVLLLIRELLPWTKKH